MKDLYKIHSLKAHTPNQQTFLCLAWVVSGDILAYKAGGEAGGGGGGEEREEEEEEEEEEEVERSMRRRWTMRSRNCRQTSVKRVARFWRRQRTCVTQTIILQAVFVP